MKKLTAALLALVMALTLCTAAWADDDTIKISTAEDFKNFIAGINGTNAYKDKTIILNNDIDLENATLTQSTGTFAGKLDGGNHTVKNFTMSKPLCSSHMGTTATIKDLTIENVTLANTEGNQARLGIVCKNLNGSLSNVTVKNCAIISTEALGVVGGLAAMTQDGSKIENCKVDGLRVTADDGAVSIGGAVGLLTGENVTVTSVSATNTTVNAKAETPVGSVFGMEQNFVEEGSTVSGNSGSEPSVTYTGVVAEVNGTKYATLASAIIAAGNTVNKTIVVLTDAEYDWGDNSYENSDAPKGLTFIGSKGTETITFAGYGSANPIKNCTFKNLKIADNTKGDTEGSWEHGYLEFDSITAENVVFVDPPQFNGTCQLTACSFTGKTVSGTETFSSSTYNLAMYAAWVNSGSMTFTNCSFAGTRGLKVHEAYGSEVTSVLVDGCTFATSDKPGVVLGTLNSTTSVVVRDSIFTGCASIATDAVSGINGLYESDTNVTSIGFASCGNTVDNVAQAHAWSKDKTGVCDNCGCTCTHEFANGVCTTCGYVCTHEFKDGVCTTCGYICTHEFKDGVCTTCGSICIHEFEDGTCTTCGFVCTHSFSGRTCTICGYKKAGTPYRAPVVETTPKAESPKTFDAGIAIYGVMAISSVLGMGYIGKKKF